MACRGVVEIMRRLGSILPVGGMALVIAVITFLFAGAARATQSVSLTWDADLSPDTTGYYVYLGKSSGNYTSKIDVGSNTVITISGLVDGSINYFMVRAYNAARIESPPSNEAIFVVPVAGLSPQTAVVSPASASMGAQVYVYGANFGSAYLVQFGGVTASFAVISSGQIVATVPPNARSGNLTVTTSSGTASTPFAVLAPVASANDNFANAQVLTGMATVVSANNSGATRQSGEPKHAGDSGGASLWYRWTAPYSGVWTVDTASSDFTPLVGIYTGSTLTGLTPVASNRVSAGSYAAAVNFNTTAGTTYQIAMDGPGGLAGNLVLSLAPRSSPATVLSNGFEAVEGFVNSTPLAGQSGWVGSGTAKTGLTNALQGYGQQAFLGFGSSTPAASSQLKRPLNFTVDTNGSPVIQFSVLMQVQSQSSLFKNIYSWAVENTAGHELFRISFDNSSDGVSYTLDNGAGAIPTGLYFNNLTVYTLTVTMDFAQNKWSAWLNGSALVNGQPMTTSGAALTLGDIAAGEVFKSTSFPGTDGMVFDNYQVTSGPGAWPRILAGPQSQTVPAGSALWLGAVANGSPVLAYQWYFNSAPISGATSPTLTVPVMTAAQAGVYSVAVSNYAGSASAAATINVSTVAPQARFASSVSTGTGGAVINLNVATANDYRLLASTNLQDWVTLQSFFANGTNVMCFDQLATNYSKRFYRLVSP